MSPLSRSLTVFLLASVTLAFPQYDTRDTNGKQQQGRVITIPPRQAFNGTKPIPDAAHPFKAPGPNDIRGPCPGLNTMANHGYIPRNGVATLEEIVNGSMEAFNMDRDLAAALSAFGILARGNALQGTVSIGGPSPLVPPLPGNIDGPIAGGLATHGRFEGDVSMTRQDKAVGDNVHFQVDLFDTMLLYVGAFGDDSPVHGNHTIVNIKSMQEFKLNRFVTDQALNKELQLHIGRLLFSYGETSFMLNFFANGTEGFLTVPVMGSFFRNQTFPANWHRRASPGTFSNISATVDVIFSAHPVPPGANNAQGEYVPDPLPLPDCALYNNLAGDNLPGVLVNTTGQLKKNVDLLVQTIFVIFADESDCVLTQPHGPAGV